MDTLTLNSNTLVYYSPYLYVLLKTLKKDKLELKLIVVDITKITESLPIIKIEDIKCITLVMYADGEKEILSNKYQ